MKKNHTLQIASLFIIIIAQNISAQDSLYKSEKNSSISLEVIGSISFFQDQNLNNWLIEANLQGLPVDSLKSIAELIAHFNLINRDNQSLSLADQLVEHKYQRKFLMLTTSEYFKNQPNYDLGVVSKYLGITKTYAALLLAILSL